MAEIQNPVDTINTSISTVIIKPGQKIILPQGAVVNSLIYDGAITVNSSCDNLPAPSAYKCGYFALVLDKDENDGHSMDERETYITSLKVANNVYVINRKLIVSGDNPGTKQTAAVLNTHVPDQSIFTFTRIQRNTAPDKRQYLYVYFKTPDALYDSIEMKVTSWGFVSYFKPLESACNVYEFGVDISIEAII